jgi:hypothetical protein
MQRVHSLIQPMVLKIRPNRPVQSIQPGTVSNPVWISFKTGKVKKKKTRKTGNFQFNSQKIGPAWLNRFDQNPRNETKRAKPTTLCILISHKITDQMVTVLINHHKLCNSKIKTTFFHECKTPLKDNKFCIQI